MATTEKTTPEPATLDLVDDVATRIKLGKAVLRRWWNSETVRGMR